MSDPNTDDIRELSEEELAEIEKKFDEGAATRAVAPGPAASGLVRSAAVGQVHAEGGDRVPW